VSGTQSSLRLVPSATLPIDTLARFLGSPHAPGAFRRSETPAYYRWLLSPPPELEAVSLCAVDGERIAGSLTALVRPLSLGGEIHLSAKLEEMKTDPRDRGRGVMSQLFAAVKEACLARGARVLLGGPTSPFSYPIFLERFGFSAPFTLENLIRPRGLRGARAQDAELERCEKLPQDALALAERVSRRAPVATLRSPSYLRWRYESHPDPYEILVSREQGRASGLAVCKQTRQRNLSLLTVVELLAEGPHEELSLLRRVARHAAALGGTDLLTVWRPMSLSRVALALRGWIPRLARTRIVSWIDPSLPAALRALLQRREAWQLSAGDFFDI
jgi:GNAT superfamily N-acetyltransferase